MKKYIFESLAIFSLGLFCASCDVMHTASDADTAQIKEDVRRLLNDIDDNNDLDKYVGPDYVERLYKWSRLLRDNHLLL